MSFVKDCTCVSVSWGSELKMTKLQIKIWNTRGPTPCPRKNSQHVKKTFGENPAMKKSWIKQLTSRCPMIWIPVAFCSHCLSLFQRLYLLNSQSGTLAFAAAVTPLAHRLWRPYFCTSKPISWNFSFTISRTLVYEILTDFLIFEYLFSNCVLFHLDQWWHQRVGQSLLVAPVHWRHPTGCRFEQS